MATTLDVGSIIQVKHQFSVGSDKAFNVWYYQLQSVVPPSGGLPPAISPTIVEAGSAVATAFYDFYLSKWKPIGSNEVSMDATTIQSVYPSPRSLPITYSGNADENKGNFVGDALPLQDSVTFLKKTAFGQRWGQGRVFIVGIPEAAQDGGVITDAYKGFCTTAATAMAAAVVAPYAGSGYRFIPVLFDGKGLTPRITPVANVFLSDNVLKTQRRRRPGKGI